jgi:hypothetical protein
MAQFSVEKPVAPGSALSGNQQQPYQPYIRPHISKRIIANDGEHGKTELPANPLKFLQRVGRSRTGADGSYVPARGTRPSWILIGLFRVVVVSK